MKLIAALLPIVLLYGDVGPARTALPTFAQVRASWRPSDVRLLDRRGVVVHELRLDRTRRRLAWTPLSEISPALQGAVVVSEDRRFFEHSGVDGRALLAATATWVRGGASRGASTISMQLASFLDADLSRRGGPRTWSQKWRQMRLAWALERSWPKREILEAYLNLASFRGELQGVAAAAGMLFDKQPHGLTAPEAVVLAALLRAPGADREAVLRRAAAIETAPARDTIAAVTRALDAPGGTGPRVLAAPHLAHRLLRDRAAGDVQSTLDADVQHLAVAAVTRQLLAVRSARVSDGAALVLDNATGDVLAYVGGAGELSSALHVDGVQARRQAGSTLKPFLYAMALDGRLLTPASLLEDTPLDVPVTGGIYRPQNYDEQFRGLVTVRTALASSLNVPAVRVLGLVGAGPFVAQLARVGFDGLRESGEYYGPSLALGSADVTLWELANAYRTLANGGMWTPLRTRLDATPPADGARAYSVEAAFLVSQILSDREARAATFGLENPLGTPYWAAVKTGTSKDMRDNWCIGYSRRYTVAVWVGNFSGQPMRNVSGITGAAPAWLEIMDALHAGGTDGPPSPPAGVVRTAVTVRDGARLPMREWFVAGTEPIGPVLAAATPRPRILAPVPGEIIAVDPDIPEDRQRVPFEARDAGRDHRWVLDGTDLGSARDLVLWPPRRGHHTLVLLEGDRRAHEVSFEVR